MSLKNSVMAGIGSQFCLIVFSSEILERIRQSPQLLT